MGAQFKEITDKLIDFIREQKIYFVGTATAESRVNVSPKGMDSLRVLTKNRIIWLNVTGSTNETSAHVQIDPRMTLLFCAFEGAPMNLRIFGKAKVIHHNDPEWDELYSEFNPIPGARQIFDFEVEMVQSSCGMATPFFDYKEERTELSDWAGKQGQEGIHKYWKKKNQISMDGIPTHILEKNI